MQHAGALHVERFRRVAVRRNLKAGDDVAARTRVNTRLAGPQPQKAARGDESECSMYAKIGAKIRFFAPLFARHGTYCSPLRLTGD